jgi:hypothetical protein
VALGDIQNDGSLAGREDTTKKKKKKEKKTKKLTSLPKYSNRSPNYLLQFPSPAPSQ